MVSGLIPVASVPAGSASYIQNSTSQQTSSNFNISRNGTAGGTVSINVVNATMQYNLGGSRVLGNAGSFPTLCRGIRVALAVHPAGGRCRHILPAPMLLAL
jgi:hypothetical protein